MKSPPTLNKSEASISSDITFTVTLRSDKQNFDWKLTFIFSGDIKSQSNKLQGNKNMFCINVRGMKSIFFMYIHDSKILLSNKISLIKMKRKKENGRIMNHR